MKRYTIRREDFFEAMGKGQLPDRTLNLEMGSIWIIVWLTEEEKNNYKFPISE